MLMRKISKKKIKKFYKNSQISINLDKIEIYDFGKPGMSFSNIILTRSRLNMLRLKDCKVRDCKFTQSIIGDDSYLRHARFENVDFTGTLFRNTNLEKAEFVNCNLNYVKFENCLLNCDSIIKNSLPEESNLKLGILNQLYKNEISNGNVEKSDEILYLIRETEKDYIHDILLAKNEYFAEKRKHNIHNYIFKYIKVLLDKRIWGYGLNVGKILKTMIIIIIIFAVMYFQLTFVEIKEILPRLKNSVFMSINAFVMGSLNVGEPEIKCCVVAQIAVLLENCIGVLYLALITSAMYRRIAR